MRLNHIHPRVDQVSELTRGYDLPLRPLHELHLLIISECLSRACHELLLQWPETLSTAHENEINALMESRLNSLLEEDGLWSQLVRGVARGKETLTYDGSHLEKRPDLSIYLTGRSPSFPLIVECKLIDARSKKTVNLYCDDGLVRFVKGEYAWATREAFMLAYVRDGSTIRSCLEPFLAENLKKQPDIYLTISLPESDDNLNPDVARSHHNREFYYTAEHQGRGPGIIALWHLWIAAGAE